MKYTVWITGLLLLLYACSRPSDPELDNPYDEQSDAFISHPDMNTQNVEGITAISAVSGGEFGSNYGYPVTEKGVCWGTSQNPTTQNSCTEEGSGNDTFVSELNNLNPDTRYYTRAYATNKAGTEYGNQQEFTTRDGIPELRTIAFRLSPRPPHKVVGK